jgi:MFS family permease
MGAAIFFSMGLCFFFSIPLVTALFARRMGRRPAVWFIMGMVLPFISSLLLFFLPDLSENKDH